MEIFRQPSKDSRVLLASTADQLIARAAASEDRLFVLSCSLQQYEVRFDDLPALAEIPTGERRTFTVDEDGAFLYWPDSDVHLGLEGIRAAVDPEFRAKALAAKLRHDLRYGKAVAELRQATGLKQSQIEGLSERQVRRIEKGEGVSTDALRCLAQAHGLSLQAYLDRVAETAAHLQQPR